MTIFLQKLKPASVGFFALFLLLAAFYGLWLVATWPGILGQDSLASMLEVDTERQFQAGKPAFWYLYARWSYGSWGLVEVPIALQLGICALVCARVLGWMATHRHWKSFVYCLFFVALAPSVVYYSGSFYSDGVYAIALAGMLFETWRCSRNKKIDTTAAVILFITIPFAVFARPNGIINIAALIFLFCLLPKRGRVRLTAIALPWCLVAGYAQVAYPNHTPIGSVFPLALYESAGFLEKRPMGLWERNQPRVTAKTVQALTSSGASLELISEYYDHYYWDPLIFFHQGPTLLRLTDDNKSTIIREFFKYNLWHNFPAFAASRVNIFLYSAFADGDFPQPTYAAEVLPLTKSASQFKKYRFSTDDWVLDWFRFSMKHKVVLWTPWLGLFLVFLSVLRLARCFGASLAMVTAVYSAQLAAVFFFSIAGEYRYLLAFFTAPLAMLPALAYHNE